MRQTVLLHSNVSVVELCYTWDLALNAADVLVCATPCREGKFPPAAGELSFVGTEPLGVT